MMGDAAAYKALEDRQEKEKLSFQKTQVEAAEKHTNMVNNLNMSHD
jgi:hypothetical protein